MARPARTSAAPKVASAGTISSRSERSTTTESAASATANQASRLDQAAKRDIGSSVIGRRNTPQAPPFGRLFRGLHGRQPVILELLAQGQFLDLAGGGVRYF